MCQKRIESDPQKERARERRPLTPIETVQSSRPSLASPSLPKPKAKIYQICDKMNLPTHLYALTVERLFLCIYANYYIVSFSLHFQAILFYVPRWLWKNWEAGKISALKMDLDLGIISEAEKRQKKKLLLDYLHSNLKNHNFWAYRWVGKFILSQIW